MCFQIEGAKLKIADKTIKVYKRFYNSFITTKRGINFKKILLSPVKEFPYERGETYYEDSMARNHWGDQIDIGLHSYSTLKRAKLHAAPFPEVIVKCEIPKGAKYYYNPRYQEYVSDTITIGTKVIR